MKLPDILNIQCIWSWHLVLQNLLLTISSISSKHPSSFHLERCCLSFLLVWIQVSRFYDHYLQKQKLVYLQKLADTDLLTDTMNRNAYEKKVNRLNVQKDKLHTTGLILFDLDNLKIINDRFGHEKGDEALQLCSQCIKQFFPDKENLFRIGGDEFAYFYNKNKENNIGDKIAQLNQTLESTEHTFNYPLSISSGYACFLRK